MPISWLTDETDLEEPEALAWTESESFDGQSWAAAVDLKCRWDQRHAIFLNIIENRLEWPYAPGSNIVARSGTMGPFERVKNSSDGHGNVYEWAKISLQFAVEAGVEPGGPGDVTTAEFTETIEPSAEFIKLNPKDANGTQVFFWSQPGVEEEDPDIVDIDNPVTDEEAPSRLNIGLDYVVRYSKLLVIPTQVMTHINGCNDDDVISPSLGLTFPAETLMLSAATVTRTFSTAPGVDYYDVELRWSLRKDGWNRYWHSKDETWKRQFRIPGPEGPYNNYPLVDMEGMLP